MNCKPTDIARTIAPYVEQGCDALVRVIRLAAHREVVGKCRNFGDFGSAWIVEGWVRDDEGVRRGPLLIIADVCLRPIRDPGEDATDETLLWLPVPQTEGVTS